MKRFLLTILCTAICIVAVLTVFFHSAKRSFENSLAEYSGSHTLSYFMPFKNGTDKTAFLLTDDGEVQLKLGAKIAAGAIKLSVVDAQGKTVFSEQGKEIALNRNEHFPKGEYTAFLEFSNAFPAAAVFSVTKTGDSSASLIPLVSLDKNYEKITPGPEDHFKWPYYLYTPQKTTGPAMLVVPNNSGFVSDNMVYHEERAKSIVQGSARYGDKLGCPVLVPVFPRWEKEENIYTHALDRDSLTTGDEDIKRLDVQLLEMIKDARKRLQERNVSLEEKVLLFGFSASGMFSNRFALLHPDKVKAAAIGSPGGWPIAPMDSFEGKRLSYPIGTADVNELAGEGANIGLFRQIPFYLFIGGEDKNDSVPYEDSYDKEDASLIFEVFGQSPVERWPLAEKIYKAAGCNARFVTYPGVGHTITPEMEEDILQFYLQNLK